MIGRIRLCVLCMPSVRYFSRNMGLVEKPMFKPKRAVVLTKMTRFEYEKEKNRLQSDDDLKDYLKEKGSDYDGLFQRHEGHHSNLKMLTESLKKNGIETQVVGRFDYTHQVIDSADVIFSAGGDGTFLLAASKILDNDKPLIGVNTDPIRSEGHLCLPKAANIPQSMEKLLAGKFRWKLRQRIRIYISGKDSYKEPIELHDQQLESLEDRFNEHVKENEMFPEANSCDAGKQTRLLPVRALNEVFIGESLSARVSYYEISVDDTNLAKQKSSGLTVCTGTGSSSWYFSINHMTDEDVRKLLLIANEFSDSNIATNNSSAIREITEKFNSTFKFDSDFPKMAYTIRDPVFNGIFQVSQPRGFAKKISIRSRMWDACLVVDGGLSFQFNDGMTADLEIHENDALKTVQLF